MAEFLAASDRALLRSVYADGRTAREIAALLHQRRRLVQRRVQRLTAHILSPEFGFVAAHARSDAPHDAATWDAPTRAVALACVLQGRSVRSTAADLGMSQHAVRARRSVILALARNVAPLRPIRTAAQSMRPSKWRNPPAKVA